MQTNKHILERFLFTYFRRFHIKGIKMHYMFATCKIWVVLRIFIVPLIILNNFYIVNLALFINVITHRNYFCSLVIYNTRQPVVGLIKYCAREAFRTYVRYLTHMQILLDMILKKLLKRNFLIMQKNPL